MKIGNTDAGQAQIDKDEATALHKSATRNAQAAVSTAEETRDELLTRMGNMEAEMARLGRALVNLDRKYNLLLSERFNTGPTEPG